MNATFNFNLKNGKEVQIRATYTCTMEREILDADGDKMETSPKPEARGKMAAFLDGEQVADCGYPAMWGLIDIPGGKGIHGLQIGFWNPEDAKRYEKWLADLKESGTSDEVKAYNAACSQKRIDEEISFARKTIAKAEKQQDIPSKEEAKRRMRDYNNLYNEGGYGYVPHIVSREEYEQAQETLRKYGA